uniref:L-amino-acid oxidase BjussuLAAO-II (Fragments) n=1 Tax=Bothrops jararacussu TaxID=8726 RepID=OXLA2_BOTJR|nr:RecName: Full=L-amino-acid oxidase BjussuLAAO-II; Short=LAO [Bothrops jararacussu]
ADDRNPLEECFRETDYEEFLEIARNGLSDTDNPKEGWYANLGPMRLNEFSQENENAWYFIKDPGVLDYPVKPSEVGKHDDIFAYEKRFDEIVGGMDKEVTVTYQTSEKFEPPLPPK